MVLNIEHLLNEKEYLSNVKKKSSLSFEVTFETRNGYKIPLVLFFSDFFPAKLPLVKINNEEFHIPKIPHILKGGLICYLDEEGNMWNQVPSITIDFVFERVEGVLNQSDYTYEYQHEFGYYFGTLDNIEVAVGNFELSDAIQEVYVYAIKNKPYVFYGKEKRHQKFIETYFSTKLVSKYKQRALYIPLEKTYTGFVPEGENFWSNKEIVDILRTSLSSENLSLLKKYESNKNHYYYLLQLPLVTGEKIIIGLWYQKINGVFKKKIVPIIEEAATDSFKVIPIMIFQRNDKVLLERGGGIMNDSKILLVGCGSVGSDVLFILARSGFKNFTIIDNDALNPYNAYRHFLGLNNAVTFEPKVELLKKEIQLRYQNVDITSINKDILYSIKDEDIDINNFDLVIVAIGDPNIERKLNQIILRTKTPAIFAWVETYGIGGHALLVNNQNSKGCYECLITEDLEFKASFASKSDRPFIQNIDGCGGSFTPYGSIDSMQTALLSSRLVLRYFNDGIKGNPLVSWKGSSNIFETNGFTTSPRFAEPLDSLERDNFSYINPQCEICCKKVEDKNSDNNQI